MFNILDRYILKKFLGTFFYAIGVIIVITVVFDISEKVDDFIEHSLSLRAILFDYYIYFIPYFANLFSPLFLFVSVIFFTAKMASDTEIVAILSSGVSFKRMLWPYFLGSLIIATMTMVLSNFVIPEANKGRIEFENTYINSKYRNYGRHQHYQIEPGTFIYFDSFSSERMVGYKFSMEKFDGEGELTYKLISDHIRWDTTKTEWTVAKYYIRHFKGGKERIEEGEKLDTTYAFHPSDFGKRLKMVEAMNYYELNEFIDGEKMKGSDHLSYFMIEKYRRFSMPFATFILTLIAVSISSRKVRGGVGMHIGIGILLSFTYIMFMQVSQTFALESSMPALLAVWIPNFAFGILGVVLLVKAPK
ncbi:MAG: lipopolysaccharide export system permease protein [Bacteroidia bacterium]|jgi:lipopolysaccharide export system permease protein